MTSSSSIPVNLVIVGGGFSGTTLMNHLVHYNLTFKKQRHLHITLIDNKEYFENTPGLPRFIGAKSDAEARTFLGDIGAKFSDAYGSDPRVRLLTPYHLVRVEPEQNLVHVSKDREGQPTEQVPYDLLVLAIGCSYPILRGAEPTMQDRWDALNQVRSQIERACHSGEGITVVGGGTTGVELAGELADRFGAKVSLVTSASRLVPRMSQAASDFAIRTLAKKGVRVITGNTLDLPAESLKNQFAVPMAAGTQVKTVRGQIHVPCSLVLATVGNSRANSAKLANLPLDSHGYIKVNQFLQVEGFANIFAMGDIAATGEEKSGVSTRGHAKLLIHNLSTLFKRKNDGTMSSISTEGWKAHKKAEVMQVVSIGRNSAVGSTAAKTLPLMKGSLAHKMKAMIIKNQKKAMLTPGAMFVMK